MMERWERKREKEGRKKIERGDRGELERGGEQDRLVAKEGERENER